MRLVKRSITPVTIHAILLGAVLSCTSSYAHPQAASQGAASQGQMQGTTSRGGGSDAQGMTSNPYIQSPPMGGGLIAQPITIPNVGAQQENNNSAPGLVYYPDIKTFVLSAGDVINIRLYGAPDYGTTLRLSKDGTGQLPLIGSVDLAGLTIQTAQTTIEDRLRSAGMYRAPRITITLVEFDESANGILFAGELHGLVSGRHAHTLGEAIGAAGGLPLTASPIVTIIRPGVDKPITVNMGTTAQDMLDANKTEIKQHDTIFIQRAGAIYVVGAFKTTGLFAMQPGRTTLLQIAALSGGPLYAARYNDMRIIRTVGSERTEVKVDVQKVLYGTAPDPILQPGDILFLPTSQIKAAISSGGFSVLVSALNVALILATR